MSSRFDKKTIEFCPEGRLRQIEYALESIRNGNSIIGIRTKTGIVLAADKIIISGLNEKTKYSDRIFIVDSHIICATTGSNADAQVLVNYARLQSQLYKQIYQEIIPIKKLVDNICDIKQHFTQSGGKRPYGASFLFGGWDNLNGFQLFRTDPSGNYSGWKGIAIGANSFIGQNILNNEINENIGINLAIGILIKIFSKKLPLINLHQAIDIVILKKDDKNNIIYYRLNSKEIEILYN